MSLLLLLDGDDESLDLAQGQTASASATYLTYSADRMVDGNDTTEAIATAAQPSWLKVDLGSSQTVGRFRCINAQFGAGNAKLQSSTDDSSWTDVPSGGIDGTTTTDTTLGSPITARYWRILNTDNNGLNIKTLSLFASSAAMGTVTMAAAAAVTVVGTATYFGAVTMAATGAVVVVAESSNSVTIAAVATVTCVGSTTSSGTPQVSLGVAPGFITLGRSS